MILKETLLLCNVCGDKTRYVGRDRNIYVFNEKKKVFITIPERNQILLMRRRPCLWEQINVKFQHILSLQEHSWCETICWKMFFGLCSQPNQS